ADRRRRPLPAGLRCPRRPGRPVSDRPEVGPGGEAVLPELGLSLEAALGLPARDRAELARFLVEWERWDAARAVLEPLPRCGALTPRQEEDLVRCWAALGEGER